MAECYECGKYVSPGQGERREVQTGRNSSVSFTSKGRMRHSSGSRYGKRTLCPECAEAHDKAGVFSAKIAGVLILLVLGLIVFASFSGTEESSSALLSQRDPASSASRECEQFNFPCSLDGIIESGDWDKIRSGLIFSSGFEPKPIDVSWKNEGNGHSGFVRFLSINRENCISYELEINTQTAQGVHPIMVCKNTDGTLSVE